MKKEPFGRPKRSLGQNFLVDQSFIDRIVKSVGARPGETVLEIGPGRGALTAKLAGTGSHVIAIELDRELIGPLKERFGDSLTVTIVNVDALEAGFRTFAPAANSKVKLAANLPYYISTAILQRLAEQRDAFDLLVLMFQREVVNRITAKPGSSERGFLTVLAEAAFDIERLFDVPPQAFRPAPKVWSSVVRLRPKPFLEHESSLRTLLSAAFAQKRKTLANNLKRVYPKIDAALENAGIDPRSRAEQLTLDEWLSLQRMIAADGFGL